MRVRQIVLDYMSTKGLRVNRRPKVWRFKGY